MLDSKQADCQADFCWPVRVYYEDTDSGGVVYYANYLKFLERARTEWFRNLSFSQNQLLQQQGIAFMVRSVNMTYHSPARLDELLCVNTWLARQRRVSLTFTQQIMREQQLLCDAEIEVACVDTQRLKPIQVPTELIAELHGDC